MELIRVKSRLAQPYAGAFLKKEDRLVDKSETSSNKSAVLYLQIIKLRKGHFSFNKNSL